MIPFLSSVGLHDLIALEALMEDIRIGMQSNYDKTKLAV